MPPQGRTARELSEAEFNAITERLYAEAPEGLSEQDFIRWMTPRFEAAIAEKEYTAPDVEGSAVGRAGAGLWEMVNPWEAVKGVGHILTNPMGVGGDLAKAQLQQFPKGWEALKEGRLSEAGGHFAAGALPVVGPIAANVGEQIGETGDVARGVGQGVGLALPLPGARAVMKVGKKVLPASTQAGIAAGLQRAAESRVVKALAPTGKNRMNVQAGRDLAKHAPAVTAMLVEEGAPWSQTGARAMVRGKAVEAIDNLNAVADERLKARSFPTEGIIAGLQRELDDITAHPVEASHLMRQADQPTAGQQRLHKRDLSQFDEAERAAVEAHDAELAALREADAAAEATYEADVASGMQREEEAVAGHQTATQALKQRERAFVLQWLADDLEEFPFQKGGTTRTMQREAYENWRPGDPESARHGFGVGAARVPGTKTYHTVEGLVSGSYAQKSNRLAKEAKKALAGKGDARFEALADAYLEAMTTREDGLPGLDFSRISQETAERLGPVARGTGWQWHSPSMPPRMTHDPGVGARLFGEDYARTDVPDVEAVRDPEMPAPGEVPVPPTPSTMPTRTPGTPPAPPGPRLTEVPLGRRVVPGPNIPQAQYLQSVIDEIKALGPVARYEAIRRIREAHDKVAKLKYNATVTPNYEKVQPGVVAAGKATSVMRETLGQWDPPTAVANKQFHTWESVDRVMESAEDQLRVQPRVGRAMMARLTGVLLGSSAGGAVGGAVGVMAGPMLEAALSSATTRLQTARVLSKLSAAVKAGDVGAVTTYAQQIRSLAKRATTGTLREVGRSTGQGEPAPQGLQ